MQEPPDYRDIVLVGGGHTHAVVLQMWAAKPLPGVRLTLVSPQAHTAYTGMLPGLIAGHYRLDETHIDLARLCRAAGARFVQACAHHIDPHAHTVSLPGRPELQYDLLSLDVGTTPAREFPGSELAIPIRPASHFHRYWQQLQERIHRDRTPRKLGVVGGGAGGCEVSMAMAHALAGQVYSGRVEIHLLHAGGGVPDGYPLLARTLVTRELKKLGVRLHRHWPVAAIFDGGVRSESGDTLALDQVLLCTGACAPPWLADSGLALDDQGFVRVDEQLRAVGYEKLFAVGDVASFDARPLPKAGVYAVRQGPVLFHNLHAVLGGQPLQTFRPQRDFLRLLSCGAKRAVAVRNGVAIAGAPLWRWKNHIDRQFMRRFAKLPVRAEEQRTRLQRSGDGRK